MSKYLPVKFIKNQWKQAFYRIYINIFGIFFGVKLLPLQIDKKSIDFYYRGDTLIWLFPWKRKSKNKWISILSEGEFKSLKEINEFWEEYYKACENKNYEEKSNEIKL